MPRKALLDRAAGAAWIVETHNRRLPRRAPPNEMLDKQKPFVFLLFFTDSYLAYGQVTSLNRNLKINPITLKLAILKYKILNVLCKFAYNYLLFSLFQFRNCSRDAQIEPQLESEIDENAKSCTSGLARSVLNLCPRI